MACSAAARRPVRTTTTSAGDVAPSSPAGSTAPAKRALQRVRTVRIALARGVSSAAFSGDGRWTFVRPDGALVATPAAGERWIVEGADGARTQADGSFVDAAFLRGATEIVALAEHHGVRD